MKLTREFEFPEPQRAVLRRAVRLECGVIGFQLTAIVLLFLVMGGSQAMRTAWFEDMLGLIPPVGFLLAIVIRDRRPNARYPYGYHRTVAIAFLAAAVALLGIGLWLAWEGLMKLWHTEHPTIGSVSLFGTRIWLGWLMLPVLVYAAVMPVILGRMLIKPAEQIHDKVLYAGADMLRADWLSAAAAFVGVLGIAIGWWWADAVAAVAISLSIIRDGIRNLKAVIGDLMDRTPEETTAERFDPLPERIEAMLQGLDWVERAEVRLREHGHVFFGEAFVVPRETDDLPEKVEQAVKRAYELDWRLQDLVIHPVPPGGRRTLPPRKRDQR